MYLQVYTGTQVYTGNVVITVVPELIIAPETPFTGNEVRDVQVTFPYTYIQQYTCIYTCIYTCTLPYTCTYDRSIVFMGRGDIRGWFRGDRTFV